LAHPYRWATSTNDITDQTIGSLITSQIVEPLDLIKPATQH
jgi:hypothetical protein